MSLTTALSVQVASDVVHLLNTQPGGTFATAFAARRVYLPAFDPKLLSKFSVLVCPNDLAREPISRRNVQKDVSVYIGVAQRLAAPTTDPAAAINLETPELAAADAVMLTAEQIGEVFVPGLTLATSQVGWIKTDHPMQFDRDAFRVDRVLLTWICATFRIAA